MRTIAIAACALYGGACLAQNTPGWSQLETYANFETAGVTATIAGDADRDATIALEWRRVGDASFRPAHPLVRVDATHLVGSLFALSPGTAYEVRATLADPDGVIGAAARTATVGTRVDALVEPSLRTLYVAPGGDDAANGLTPQTALRTIQRGADLAQPGDVVLVAPGVYRESVTARRSGTAVQPVVFRGNGAGVVLDGAATLSPSTAWTALANGVWRTPLAATTGHVVDEQGRLYRYDSLADLAALGAGAPGGWWLDGTQQLHVKFADGQPPAAHAIDVARLENGFTVDGYAHVRIENFDIRHYGAGDYGKGVYLRYASDVVVRANRIRDIGAAGVWIKGGDRHRIEDNAFTDTSIAGWPWDYTKGSSAENSAVVLTDDVGRGHVIRRNTTDGGFNGIAPCGGSAPPGGALTSEVDVYRNDLRRHNDDAFEPEGWCANVRLFENTIRDSHMAFAVAPAAPGPTWIVRNVAWNTGNTRTSQVDGYVASALKINSGYPTPIGPLLVYHNTFATTAPSTDAINLLNPGSSTFLRLRNNIVAGTRYVVEKSNPIAADMDGDLLYTSDSSRFVRWMGATYANLTVLRNALGLEANGVAAPPQLLAPATGDFRPAPGSAAIDRGVVIAGINDGYAGAAPDIGAYEFADVIFVNRFEPVSP